MAHLLGNKYCIESLQKDIADLQASVTDVMSRSGPVKLASWKYPDKIASQLDIADLLDTYDYVEGEDEDCQVAHIILLELVIDRFVLLLQSMSLYMDQVLSLGRHVQTAKVSGNTSIGLVVKKYWSKMVQMNTVAKQLQSEARVKNRKLLDLENSIVKQTFELEELGKQDGKNSLGTAEGRSIKAPSTIDELNNSGLLSNLSVTSPQPYDVARDESNKSSQTVETAFVPCDGCDRVQKNLRQTSDIFINICLKQELPSCLARHKVQMEHVDWLTASDVTRWITEQNKDLTRIGKHLEHLLGMISPLEEELAAEKKKCKNFEEKFKESQRKSNAEHETLVTTQKQFELKLKKLNETHAEEMRTLELQNSGLGQEKTKLETSVQQLKNDLSKTADNLSNIEFAKRDLDERLKASLANQKAIEVLEEESAELKKQLAIAYKELDQVRINLEKEKAKSSSVTRHNQSVQGKQDALLSQLETTIKDNEELNDQIAELEEEKESLQESWEKTETEKRAMEKELEKEKHTSERLSKDMGTLEESILELKANISALEEQVQEAEHREKLLLQYPDLNGPVNPDFEGTGDIMVDMQNQVQANSRRIVTLEQQNASLRNSISKFLQKQGSNQQDLSGVTNTGPMPLWQNTHLDSDDVRGTFQNRQTVSESNILSDTAYGSSNQLHGRQSQQSEQRRDRKSTSTPRGETFVISRGLHPSQNKKTSRPPSGARKKPDYVQGVVNTGLNAYIQLKKDGRIKSERPGVRSRSSSTSGDTSYRKEEMFICNRCDKMYSSRKDLTVHKSYCTA